MKAYRNFNGSTIWGLGTIQLNSEIGHPCKYEFLSHDGGRVLLKDAQDMIQNGITILIDPKPILLQKIEHNDFVTCKNCRFYKMELDGFGGCGNPNVVGSSHVNTWLSPEIPVLDTLPSVWVEGDEYDGVGFSPDFGCIHFE